MTTAAQTPPTAAPPWLVTELAAGKVLSADRAARLAAAFDADLDSPRKDAAGFAEYLVQEGVLTQFQADRALAGQARGLAVGPYSLQEPVGTGSLGTVYRAVHRGTRAKFAVKLLPVRSLWNVLQAKKQVQTFAALPPHPAIVPFVDVDTADGAHYLAWPFVEGESFEWVVRRSGPLPPAHAARFVADICEGLAACHDRGITHGLLKPANLLLGADRKPRLLDLGMGAILSENIADSESMLDTISTANTALSSFDYAAPEIVMAPTERTAAGDVYSLGCVLYFLLTGGPPFPDGNAVDKILAHTTQEPEPVRERNPYVPVGLAELLTEMMRKAPADRPADLLALSAALRTAGTASATESGILPSGSGLLSGVGSGSGLQLDAPPPAPPADAGPVSITISRLRAAYSDPVLTTPAPRDDTAASVDFDIPGDEPPGSILPLPGPSTPLRPTVGLNSGTRLGRPAPPPLPASLQKPIVLPPMAPPPAKPADLPPPSSRVRSLPDLIAWTPAAATEQPSNGPDLLRPPSTADLPSAKGGWLRNLSQLAKKLLPAALKTVSDEVQVSVFGPREVGPGKTVRLQVYSHPPGAFASVCTLSRALQPDSELLAVGYLGRPVPRGGELGLHLSVANAAVVRSLVRFNWQGQPKAEPFEVHIPWESPAGRTPGLLTVGLNNAEAARVRIDLIVLARGVVPAKPRA
jgi:serine/threonine protein kinase